MLLKLAQRTVSVCLAQVGVQQPCTVTGPQGSSRHSALPGLPDTFMERDVLCGFLDRDSSSHTRGDAVLGEADGRDDPLCQMPDAPRRNARLRTAASHDAAVEPDT